MSGRRAMPKIATVVVAGACAWTPGVRASPPHDPAPDEPGDATDPSDPPEPEPPEPEPPEPEPARVTEIEPTQAPQGGGVAGSVVSADDPAAKQAQADLEGEKLDRQATGVPARMSPMRAAAWWTMFGTVALGTVGGVFSGLAERREDEAEQLALGFDLETGRRFRYEDYADEYEGILDEGRRFQWISRGFLIGAGAALVASITLFAVQAKRERARAGTGARELALRRIGPGGLEVGF